MKIDNTDYEYAIYGMLFSLSNRIQTIGDKELEDITLKQHFLLVALEMFTTPPTLKQMGELVGCSYQNVKRMAEQLEKKNYLQIKKDETDKRKLLLVSTGKKQELEGEINKVTTEFMERLYRDIPKENLIITLQTLMKMDQNIGGAVEL